MLPKSAFTEIGTRGFHDSEFRRRAGSGILDSDNAAPAELDFGTFTN